MHDAPTTPNAADASQTQQFLSFAVDGEEYGVDIMTVREIKGWATTTRLPNSPEYMRGVMNLRGLIIPIFDLRCRFGAGMTEATDKHVVIILAVPQGGASAEKNIGLLVDAVSDILTIAATEIRPAPDREEGAEDAFVTGLIAYEERMVVLLDVARLFDAETVQRAALSPNPSPLPLPDAA